MLPHHVSESLVMRMLQDHHAPEVFALVEANRAFLRERLSWLDGTTDVESSRTFIREFLTAYVETGAFVCGIWHEGNLCGVIGHNGIDWNTRTSNLGYWLAENHQGRGIVTRCCRTLIDHAFTEYHLGQIEIHCAIANGKSQAIAERLGFIRQGILKDAEWMYDHNVDHIVYSIDREKWSARVTG